MTQEALERCLDEKVEPALDPEKERALVLFVGEGGHGSILIRRAGPNALRALAIELLEAAERSNDTRRI
jgi:hypothetical protein